MNVTEVLDRFGIRSLSPSSLTCWADDRATWVLRYGLKTKEVPTPNMIRGRAVEDGFKALLYGAGLEEAQEIAARLYRLEAEKDGLDLETEESVKCEGEIAAMIGQCAEAIQSRSLPQPNGTQLRCETFLDYEGYSLPISGYCDFAFEGYTLDLKTTKALPSDAKPAHVAQVAVYAKARQETDAALLYVTPKKWGLYGVDEDTINTAWNRLLPQGRSLIRALARAKSVADLCADFPPPLDSWAWDDDRRARAAQLVPEWTA
jgi:hypothetical protein